MIRNVKKLIHSESYLHILAVFFICCNSHTISEFRIANTPIYEMPIKLFLSGRSLETHSQGK